MERIQGNGIIYLMILQVVKKTGGCYATAYKLWGAHHHELINHPAYEPFGI
jgi:hypothetical protein